MTLPSQEEVERRVTRVENSFESGDGVLFGESGRLAVELAEPSASWPARFVDYRDQLRAALGAGVRIEHVGSTSIGGLEAKPIIDIQVSVADMNDEGSYRPQIEALGWPMRAREVALGHSYFRDPAGTSRRAHVHVCQAGSKWERDHLLFRDYLRSHPERAREYAALKRAACDRYGNSGIAYTEAKGPFIEHSLALAEAWATDTGWTYDDLSTLDYEVEPA